MNVDTVEMWLQTHTGLDPSTLGVDVVARAARDRITFLRCRSPEDYVAILGVSADERQALIERVVVPETWFFRDRAALESVARHVVETWGPAHPGATFRILSVPCATGEEPYSIVMAFALAGWPLERLRVEAVDISQQGLGRAARGRYRRGSFRGEDLAYREQFFTLDGPETWRVNDQVVLPVHFELGNLLAADFGAQRGTYEAIFCRNLLIYFDRATQVRAIRVLSELLAPDGWLAVGPAEPVLFLEHGFAIRETTGAFLLQRAPVPELPLRANRTQPTRRAESPVSTRRLMTAGAERKTPRPVRGPELAAADSLETIRALANSGQLRAAAERGAALLARTTPSAELYYLLGVVADAAAEGKRAEALYRKALYLDPRHVDALSHLALLAEKHGDERGAKQFRERAQRLAGKAGA